MSRMSSSAPFRRPQAGFSLVELLVALAVTSILMVGMAGIFKSSLGTFSSTGDRLSNLRRNRMALDLIFDDLNAAGMYMTNLSDPPTFTLSNEPIRVDPNATKQATIAGALSDSDQLYLTWDEPMSFEPKIQISGGGGGAGAQVGQASNLKVANRTALPTNLEESYTLACPDAVTAKLLADTINRTGADPALLSRSQIAKVAGLKTGSAVASGVNVTVTTRGSSGFDMPDQTPFGPTGIQTSVNSDVNTLNNTEMIMANKLQQFRYSIQMVQRDTADTGLIPCLVREQGTYQMTTFTPDPTLTVVVAENVETMKVYLSMDWGRTWVGKDGAVPASWAAFKTALDNQLTAAGGSATKSTTTTDVNWYRAIPTLVRLDLTTRSFFKRSEFGTADGMGKVTPDYQRKTQSLVILPRHFGLPY